MTQLCRSSTCSSPERGENKALTFECIQKIQVWLLLTFTFSPRRTSVYFFSVAENENEGRLLINLSVYLAERIHAIRSVIVFSELCLETGFSRPRTNLRYPGNHLTKEPNPRIFIKWSTGRGKCEPICETHPSLLSLQVRHRRVLSLKNNSCRL